MGRAVARGLLRERREPPADVIPVCEATRPGTCAVVAGAIEIQLPRVPDRDELISSLRERGFKARPVERDGCCALEVTRVGNGQGREPMDAVEEWIAESGAPLVPERTSDGSFLLRPYGD